VPSITGSQTGRRTKVFGPLGSNPNALLGDRWVNNPLKQDIGITVKYTLSPNITLDAAYNPDFAEIEADAPVVTANINDFRSFLKRRDPSSWKVWRYFSPPLRIFSLANDRGSRCCGQADRPRSGKRRLVFLPLRIKLREIMERTI
jgi:hypothetical protein